MSDFNCTTYPTARKPHRCHECSRAIAKGERYSRTASVWEGDFFTNVACMHCAVARVIVDYYSEWYSEGYYGGLAEYLSEHADHVWSRRLWVGVRRQWLRFDGTGLMDLPRNPWPDSTSPATSIAVVLGWAS